MAVYKRDIIDINLETGNIYRSWLKHSIGYKDQKADHFGVRVFRDGEAVSLTGVSVQGVFMPPQGSPIAITSGNIVSGNVAEVVLPQACYNYDGQFTLAIKLVDSTNSVTGTVRIVDGMVDNTHASGTVAPTSAVPTYQEVLSVYEQAIVVIGKSVRFDTDQSLTDAQKTTARTNIAAASTGELNDVKSAIEQTDYDISPYTGRFVVIAVHNNAYIKDTDGKLASYANWVASDFIPCTPGTVIHIKSRNGKYNAFYTDKNESSFLQALNYGDTVVPQTAKYFRVSTQKSVYDQYGFEITTDQTGFDIALTRVEDSISTASKWQAFSNDMNNLAENKIYQIMYNDGVSNLPFSGYFGTVVTFTHNNSSESKTTVQLAFGRYGKSAWRMKWGSTWGEWNLISIEQNSIMSSLISLSSDSVWSDYNYDFDNLPINKIFQIVYTNEDEEDTEHNTKHSPVPAFRGNVITFDYDPFSASKTQVQLAFARNGKTYRRMMWGSTWASWYEFANMDDIPNVGTAYKGLGDFIACGDSNTVSLSYPTSESGIPVKSWATSLAEMIGSDCDIYAAGGRSTAGFINSDDYAPAIADTKQFAILYLGINDCSQSVEIETFTANYTTIVNALLTNHQFVFCLNIPAAVQPSSRRSQYNTAIESVCSSIQKAFLVDITGCSDRIAVYKNVGHLSSVGYAVLAGEIAQAINKTMSENDYFDAQIDVDSN